MSDATLEPLALDQLGDGLGAPATVLRANAVAAGLDASVPTCPGWTVLDLVAHTGMVHRWAASHLAGSPVDAQPLEVEGRGSPDVLGWFDEGATALLQAIVDAPDDLEALVFLLGAPPARHFWARRQCHETTIHAVDALAARLGRTPRPEETWIRPAVALDGLDELLRGFVPRPRQRATPPEPTTLLVRPDGADVAWLVDLAPDRPPVTSVVASAEARAVPADHVLAGSPVDLYLRLWSRGGGGASLPTGPTDELERWWRAHVSVTW